MLTLSLLLQPRDHRIYLDPTGGRIERLGPGFGKAARRPFLVSVFDPFNIYGIVTGKGLAVHKFWEEEQPVVEGSFADKKGAKGINLQAA